MVRTKFCPNIIKFNDGKTLFQISKYQITKKQDKFTVTFPTTLNVRQTNYQIRF